MDTIDQRTLWFRTYLDALNFTRKWELEQKPTARVVWLDYAWRLEWSLRVPINWTIPLRNNQRGNAGGT